MRDVVLEGPRGLRLRCHVAVRRTDRLRGLLRMTLLSVDEALLLPNTTSVHTFGMRLPILVAQLDAELRVVLTRRLPPRRVVLPRPGSRHVLEGSESLDLRPGDRLWVVPAKTAERPR